MANIEALRAMKIGVDHVVWSPLVEDTAGNLSYLMDKQAIPEPIIYDLPGVMVLNINPNGAIETAFYDNGPGEIGVTIGNVEVTFNKSCLGPKEAALILGKTWTVLKDEATPTPGDAGEVLVSGVGHIAPWGALGFRSLKSDGTYRYVWLYKGRFSEPSTNNESKGDSINFQGDEITGRFVKVNHEFTVTTATTPSVVTKKIKPWKLEFDPQGVDIAYSPNTIAADWFTKVIQPDYTI